MIPHVILLQWHAMVGVDIHAEVTATPPPVPVPTVPHAVGMVLYGITPLGRKTTGDDVKADGQKIIQKGSDIASLIPHVPIPPYPPCVLLVTIIPFSGSKSYFGASQVIADKTPVACCLFLGININLNCGDPWPTPTGFIQAVSTVLVGMTWGDLLAGLIAMAYDACVQAAINKATAGAAKYLAPGLPKFLSPQAAAAAESYLAALIQQITGSPVGYTWSAGQHATGDPSDSNNPYNPGNWGGMAGDQAGQAMDKATGEAPPSPSQPANPGSSPASHPGPNDPHTEQH